MTTKERLRQRLSEEQDRCDLYKAVVEDALAAFLTDSSYATAMASTATSILRRRHQFEERLALRPQGLRRRRLCGELRPLDQFSLVTRGCDLCTASSARAPPP